MSDPLASPPARRLPVPGWLDGRLLLGVLMVLVSVVAGARVLGSSDDSQPVWVATHALGAGSTLADDDLQPGRARLYDAGSRYLLAEGAKPVGYVLRRDVGPGELVPRDGLARPDEPGEDLREVSVPVAPGHLPEDLASGQHVDVYLTPTSGSARVADGTRLVLPRVAVGLRPRGGGLGAGGTTGVVLSVPAAQAAGLVAAVQEGTLDLVRVPAGSRLPSLAPPAVAAADG